MVSIEYKTDISLALGREIFRQADDGIYLKNKFFKYLRTKEYDDFLSLLFDECSGCDIDFPEYFDDALHDFSINKHEKELFEICKAFVIGMKES